MKVIGYRQIMEYLADKMTFKELKSKCLYATRQLAKRQITWIRSWDEFTEINSDEYELLHKKIKKLISAL